MKSMKTRITTILMVAVLIISTTAVAQKTMGPQNKKEGQEMMKRGMKPSAQKADFLTQEQKETMQKLRLESAKAIKPLKNELRELMAHQQTLTTADNADLKAINKNIDKMTEIKGEIAKILAKQHQEFRAQLTEEQLIKFDSRKNQMHKRKGNQDHKQRVDRGEAPEHRSGV